jgi:hypothetical protein
LLRRGKTSPPKKRNLRSSAPSADKKRLAGDDCLQAVVFNFTQNAPAVPGLNY